jgi:hypothetical protein
MYTIAGSSAGTAGHTGDGGPATSALLQHPTALAIDAEGDLYIADTFNNRIQFLSQMPSCSSSCAWGLSATSPGDIYTIAGSSTGSSGDSGNGTAGASARFNSPAGLALDSEGNVYFQDVNNCRIVELASMSAASWGFSSLTPNDIYTIGGSGSCGFSGDGGGATGAEMDGATYYPSIAVDSAGDVYLADGVNNRVRELARATAGPRCQRRRLAEQTRPSRT